MSDRPTPMTDAVWMATAQIDGIEAQNMLADHARSLERRLAAARKLLTEAREILPMDMRVYSRIQEAISHLTP